MPALNQSSFGSMKISRILPLLSVLMASCGVEGLSPDRKAVGGCQMESERSACNDASAIRADKEEERI